MHRLDRLREVQDKGATAQAQRARGLIAALERNAADPQSEAEADALIEAYLHDPYLTKDVPGNGSSN